MTIIGITGPTGAGKTTALEVLREMGGHVIDCDALYYRLLRQDEELRRALTAAFGPIFLPTGELDRQKLGTLVFGDPRELARLDGVVYPVMRRAVMRELERAGGGIGVIDAIDLLESGLGKICDATVAVTAPQALRLARIMARDGISEDYARRRIAAQKPDSYYCRCGYLLENRAGDRESFRGQAQAFFTALLSGLPGRHTVLQGGTGPMDAKEWKEKLLHKSRNGYDVLTEGDRAAMEDYCRRYRAYLDRGKTERECVKETLRLAQAKGFEPLAPGAKLAAGDKVYFVNREKAVFLAVVGKRDLSHGATIVAAHIDSPRLDLKPCPLYEDGELAYGKTHYYGGIRKYQWVATPLELRGVVSLTDGTNVEVAIGEGDEAKLVITDLLPHLGQEQNKKTLGEAFPGENLNILLGSCPLGDPEDKDRVKLAVMRALYEKYSITEEDFLSAELSAVPAGMSCEIGIDGSMIGAYGHDDRVCAYAALNAMLTLPAVPERTAVCLLVDKEEIGSEGVSGMQSAAFDTFLRRLCEGQGAALADCLEKSFCLSADVTAAFDPCYADVFDRRNACRLNYGVGICKYTGARGKSGASDASAEVVARLRRAFTEKNVLWQMGELGKVDLGGGGTVAMYMANRNIDTIDAGVPVLSMHAPFEVVAKVDCYRTQRAMRAVYECLDH